MFQHLLGLESFDSLVGPLTCKQTFLWITFNYIDLISITPIALTTYLRSWALVALIIIARYIVDHFSFLFEPLAWVATPPFFSSNISKWHVIFYCPQFTHVFLHLNNSLNNKRFDFKISFQNVCTIIPFLTCFLIGYLKPIMLEFDHVLAQGWTFSL